MKQITTIIISVTIGLLTACNKPATAQSESKQATSQPTSPTASTPQSANAPNSSEVILYSMPAASAQQPGTSPGKPAANEPANSTITAPPTVVIPMETLSSKYGWVKKEKSLECSLSKVTPSSSMARVGRVFVLHDMALGQLAVDGECFWDMDGVHLLKGRAYLVPGSKDGPIVAVKWD